MSSSNNPHVPSHLVGSDGEIMSKQKIPQHQSQQQQQLEDDSLLGRGEGGGVDSDPTMGLFTQESPQQGNLFCIFVKDFLITFA